MAWTPSRFALAAMTTCVVAAGAGAGLLLQPTADRPERMARGPNVSIDVVPPREPVPEPGGVMDVGDLADVYSHQGDVQPAAVVFRPREVSESDPPAPLRAERPRVVATEPAAKSVVAEPREPSRRWPFGFDQPRPDYAAERRDRRARLDEQRRYDEEQRLEEVRMADDRRVWSESRDDRGREVYPGRDDDTRQRQWYRSDGRPVAGPGARD